MAATVVSIPSLGFARGAVVRLKSGSPNMIVVRGLDATTACVLCENDDAGSLRLKEFKTDDLVQILPSNC